MDNQEYEQIIENGHPYYAAMSYIYLKQPENAAPLLESIMSPLKTNIDLLEEVLNLYVENCYPAPEHFLKLVGVLETRESLYLSDESEAVLNEK